MPSHEFELAKTTLSVAHRNLGYKLFVIFFLMFVLPVSYLLYVVWELTQHALNPGETASFAMLSPKIGVPAAVLMSVSGLVLMYVSIRPIQLITKSAYAFYKELHGEQQAQVVLGSADEAQSIALYVTDMITELRKKLSDVDRYARDLDDANKKLMELAVNDGLTELYNQKHIRHMLASELLRAQRFHHTLGIIIGDIDNFKGFNDTFGHLLGDKALKDISRIIRRNIRAVDIPARYGGEEFLIVLPEADLNTAIAVAERVREAVATHPFDTGKGDERAHLSMSMGTSAYMGVALSDRQLISQADENMYRAKRSGKNRVCS